MVTATGGASGNAVTFTSTTDLVCSVAGSTVTALAAGNCVIAANQAANANYTAAPQATQTIAVSAGQQSLIFGSTPTLAVGGTGTVTATGGSSGNPVTFTSINPKVCAVSGTNGSTVTALAAGNCIIAANQAANVNYSAAPQATLTITIRKVSPAKTYSDNGDGTVTDPTTGLTWLRCSMGQTWDGKTCTGTAGTYTFDQANALTSMVRFAGQNDWRLPNIRELLTIVDRSKYFPAIDPIAFPATSSSVFWSASADAYDSAGAWYVAFGYGDAGSFYKYGVNQVRLVRAGQSFGLLNIARPDTDYVDQGDGTAMHTPSHLIWQRCAVGQSWTGTTCSGTPSTYTWEAAKALTSSFAGQTDWRLPTEEELLSLVDYGKVGPAINSSLFPAASFPWWFWSASAYADDYKFDFAWVVFFGRGEADGDGKIAGNGNQVRFVRDGQCFALSVVSSAGTGQITSRADTGMACNTAAGATGYFTGDVVTLTASPAANLISWGGACTSTSAATTCTVTMDSEKTVTASFKGSQNLIFGSAPTLAVGGTGTVTATGGASGNAVTFTSATDLVCSLAGSTVTALAAGNCVIAANQAANANYSAAPQATQTIAVSAGAQSLTLGLTPTLAVGGTATVSATGGASGNAVTFTSTTSAICTTGGTNGSTVTALTAGNCVIAANQAANANYSAAPQATQTIAVSAGAQSLTFGLAPTLVVGGTGTVTATGGASGNPITFASTTLSVCSVTGSTVKALTAGDCTVTADQAGNANYTAAAQAKQTITIGKTGLDLLPGWNLLGNASDQPVAVDAVFADKSLVNTVWKWDAATPGWQFYTPTLLAADLQTYAVSKNYGVLTSINPGEGFWVNASAKVKTTLPAFAGAPFYLGASQLVQGWNLVATAANATPAAFNLSLTDPLAPPPSTGSVPINLTTLWAWDNPLSKWCFYAPNLEGQGGTALFDYTAGKGYLDFTATGKLLGSGMGFWVNKP
jgi:hypothetical protein